MSRYKPMSLDDEFKFGKQHKGEPLWQVMQNDLDYVAFLVEDASMDFEMDNEAFAEYERLKQERTR